MSLMRHLAFALTLSAPISAACSLYQEEDVVIDVRNGPGPVYLIVGSPDGSFQTIEHPDRSYPDWAIEHEDGAVYTLFRPEVTPRFVTFLGVEGGARLSFASPADPDITSYDEWYDLQWPAYAAVDPATYSVQVGCEQDQPDEWVSEVVSVTEPSVRIEAPGCWDFQVRIVALAASGEPLASLFQLVSEDARYDTTELPDAWAPLITHRREVDVPAETVEMRFEFEAWLFATSVSADVADLDRVVLELPVPEAAGTAQLVAISDDGRYSTISERYWPGQTPDRALPSWPPRPFAPTVDPVTRLVTWETRGDGVHDRSAVELDAEGDGVAEWRILDLRAPSEIEIPTLPALYDPVVPPLDTSIAMVNLRFEAEYFFVTSFAWSVDREARR